ncbi:MAG: DUF1294 domain-containing protein [Planctomycetes bacterium]|nr:DUF1294 domain-containing protein [Planctomycetota bacterium]
MSQPLWIALAGINLVALVVFAVDKRRARRGRPRIPESVLLTTALLGGTAGAWLAILFLRHKNRKITFLIPMVVITVLQAAALAWWLQGG